MPTRPAPPGPTTRDLPPPPGVTLVPGGADVAVYAGHAEAVDVCLFEPGDTAGTSERRVALRERAHGWWFGFVPGMGPGTRYGVRVDGPWSPDHGLHHNPAKLLLDPYAGAVEGEVAWGPEVYGHRVDERWRGDLEQRSPLDSRGHVPRGVVVDHSFDWGDDAPPRRSRSETVVYEAHVRNQTMLLPGVPEHLRGTYAGLAHPASVEHLLSLGVTTVELLPVHAFTHEPHLVQRGLTNHWGYNTLGFMAPHARYAAASDPQGVVDEVKGMVKLLHAAGIEVVLDVVYNHTAEQSRSGAMLSWRGLDQRAYYRLDERGRDIDVTGCGNTLDLRHPVVCRMVLDSLRHWVQTYRVDGFRFDLAVALGRGRGDDYDPDHPFLVALRTDPVLSRVVLVAEPWDLGMHGWRTGQFPPPFLEWNDRFRDTARRFWVGDVRAQSLGERGHDARELATRLSGSRDLFGARDRGPTASVNFVTAHDGMTLADLVAYDRKHNEANGEDNRDGTDGNGSWNHGVEGPTDDPEVLAARTRAVRALLGTLLLSQGVPMLTAGDEMGRTQGGNNNPYCQDNEVSWVDWELAPWQEDLLETTKHLLALRRAHPVLRQRTWLTGREVDDEGTLDVAWYAADGRPMGDRWHGEGTRVLQMALAPPVDGSSAALLVVHGGVGDTEVTLPTGRHRLLWDSAWERPRAQDAPHEGTVLVAGPSVRLYAPA
ncbi:glycogen debranching protein GlgX [Phycicoccus jejuensis]|uniref:glycogen debranching protein GlgX n=1 Tax=Phycicoccus jejuensis TaxID=367299 RepID=UPI00068957F8|nr:glycogen debranching protein GlgX [Phycicoccus jejuensis]